MVNTTAIAIGGKGWQIGMGNGYMPQKMRQQYEELFGLIGAYGIKLLIDQNPRLEHPAAVQGGSRA